MNKHFPNDWVSPIVSSRLWKDLDEEIVVSSLEYGWRRVLYVPCEAHQILAHTLVSVIESALVVFTLAFAKGYEAPSVPAPYQHTSVIDSVQSGHIGDTVRVDKDQGEVLRLEDFVALRFEVPLWPCALELPSRSSFTIEV